MQKKISIYAKIHFLQRGQKAGNPLNMINNQHKKILQSHQKLNFKSRKGPNVIFGILRNIRFT